MNWNGSLHLIMLKIFATSTVQPLNGIHLQRLVKHTDADHPDFALLQRAEREIHDLALRINNVERESDEQEGRQQMLR